MINQQGFHKSCHFVSNLAHRLSSYEVQWHIFQCPFFPCQMDGLNSAWPQRNCTNFDLLIILAVYKVMTLKMLMQHRLGEVSGRRTGLEIKSSAYNLPIHLLTQLRLSINYVLTDSWLQWLISSAKQEHSPVEIGECTACRTTDG